MRRNRILLTTLYLLLVVALLGCAARSAPRSATEESLPQPPMAAPQSDRAGNATGNKAELSQDATRMIIVTVNMSMLVDDTEQTLQALQGIVSAQKGYTADSRKWYVDDQPYAAITVRIPAGSLDATMAQIRALAIRVDSENTTGQDVTEEYTDLQSRLRNLEATERELLALLTEVRENQGKAEEILAVYRELTNIRGEIESLKGRQQYLERMTALATIQIELKPKAAPTSVLEPAAWNPVVIANRALRALVDVVKALASLAIYVVVLSPLVIVPAIVLWLIVRALQRRRGHRNANTTLPSGTPQS